MGAANSDPDMSLNRVRRRGCKQSKVQIDVIHVQICSSHCEVIRLYPSTIGADDHVIEFPHTSANLWLFTFLYSNGVNSFRTPPGPVV